MKINRVRVKNFKSLKDIDILLSNLTLITGINSSGKSSFIQSLLLLKQNQNNIKLIGQSQIIQKSLESNSKIDKNSLLIKAWQKLIDDSKRLPLLLNDEYIKLGEKQNILFQEAFDEDISIELFIEDTPSKVYFDNKKLILKIETKIPMESMFNIFQDDFQYISTDRVSPNITYPLSDFNINKNLIGLNGEYTAHYLSVNRHKNLNIEKLKHPNSKTNQLLENVSLWLGEISIGIDISTKIYNELQAVNLTYSYIYGDKKTEEYTPINVGFGITYVLPIIVAILKSKPDDLLIMENPESHLHPSAQSKIAELCAIAATNGVQIIIETHSDHFLNGIRVATKKSILKPEESQIYYFEKEKDSLESKPKKLNIDKNGKIDHWPKGFFDQFDNDLDKLVIW